MKRKEKGGEEEEEKARAAALRKPSARELRRLWDGSAHQLLSKLTVADMPFKGPVVTVKAGARVQAGMKLLHLQDPFAATTYVGPGGHGCAWVGSYVAMGSVLNMEGVQAWE